MTVDPRDLVIEEHKVGPVEVLRMRGTVDSNTSHQLESAIERRVKSGRNKIIVVLAGVSFMSSAGWGVLLGNLRDAKAQGGSIVVAEMAPEVRKVYDILGVAPVLKEFGTESEAVQKLR